MKVDPVTISAYLDGEVEEPFASEIAALIENDQQAHAYAEHARETRAALQRVPVMDLDGSAARSWQMLSLMRHRTGRKGWGRRVALPVPALVGAAAALLVMVGLTVFSFLPERPNAGDYLTNASGVDVTIRVDGNDMEQVLQWLVDKNMLGEVNIQLPEQRFQIVGEPVLLKPDIPPEVVEE